MTSRPNFSEAQLLENHRVALQNVETQPTVAATMAELGYESAKLLEGKALLELARQAVDFAVKEGHETTEAYEQFDTLRTQLDNTYVMHRKKAKVVFRDDALTRQKLAIDGTLSRAYIKWIETVKKFYTEAAVETVAAQLSHLKISQADLTAAQSTIASLEAARATYLKEKGESQDATQRKSTAIDNINDWMARFYAVARIALDDSPQLLEALGKTVKAN
jgi:hypothetical protein